MSTIFHFHLSPTNIHYQPLPPLANSPHQLPMLSPLKTTHHLHSNSPMFTNPSHRAEKWSQAMVYANRSDRWRWIASDQHLGDSCQSWQWMWHTWMEASCDDGDEGWHKLKDQGWHKLNYLVKKNRFYLKHWPYLVNTPRCANIILEKRCPPKCLKFITISSAICWRSRLFTEKLGFFFLCWHSFFIYFSVGRKMWFGEVFWLIWWGSQSFLFCV